MPHFPGSGDAPHPTNHIMAGPSLRFVNYHQSRKHASQYIGAGSGPGPHPRSAGHGHADWHGTGSGPGTGRALAGAAAIVPGHG